MKTLRHISNNTIYLFLIGVGILFISDIFTYSGQFYKYYLSVFLLIVYLLFNLSSLKFVSNISSRLFFFFIISNLFVDFFLNYSNEFNTKYRAIVLILLYILLYVFYSDRFMLYKSKYNLEDALLMFIKPYMYICILIVSLSVLAFIFTILGLINPSLSSIPYYFGYEFTSRAELSGLFFKGSDELLFVGNFVIFGNYTRLFGNLFPYVFLGWSYEPHLSTFFITPSFFFLRYYFKNRSVYMTFVFLYIIFFIGSGSATNLICILITAVFYLLFSKDRVRASTFLKFFFLTLVLLLIFFYAFHFSFENFEFVINRVGSENRSKSTSLSFLSYIFTFDSFGGGGILRMPNFYVLETINIGFFGAIYFYTFYIVLFYRSFVLLVSQNRILMSIGLASLYFLMHSFKFPMHIINYPFSVMFIFLIFIAKVKININYDTTSFSIDHH